MTKYLFKIINNSLFIQIKLFALYIGFAVEIKHETIVDVPRENVAAAISNAGFDNVRTEICIAVAFDAVMIGWASLVETN